ncbi:MULTISPECIES: alpha/beta hydrolase [Pseudomonas]|uniref:Alpha/beta fold hydrolase n=1 Tax=Pseudomonas baltica TaxID=2762576 RepID=A0A7X1G4T4_9PSED|nr:MULTISPECIES: alpha/beta fold hydrolase [Pseudomonas]MBC2678415.1 alpha/beta fold hydrolase [Pseudomonas baltica]MBD8592725.1 alpha/beta fold hydrolase [Pseudomonas sp. CFBP 8758]MBD8602301.1 alpha/beta fold hydrolase [Pseudomonas sp. CFBP 8771]MBD8622531.1 alpha/beta fold hydrolase [Pseudomonas sp. CFBP 13727]MBD8828422.1 alpha/beta fold hydrolase [Pseudomonas sp. CFBP 13602]
MLIRETAVFIDGPSGSLEALYLDTADATGIALICHPNPVQGGTMLNKVVSTLQRTARDVGLSTLRFNYRGVGASAGSHDMGTGEVDDAQAVAAWLRAKHPELPLTILGFSFGGFVAATLAGRLEAQGEAVKHLFMVAPAVMRMTESLPQQATLTVIQPDADEVVDPQLVYDWSDNLDRPHELLKVAECGHFFHGKLTDLKDLLLPRLSN